MVSPPRVTVHLSRDVLENNITAAYSKFNLISTKTISYTVLYKNILIPLAAMSISSSSFALTTKLKVQYFEEHKRVLDKVPKLLKKEL